MKDKKERLKIYTLLLHYYENEESRICSYGLCFAFANLYKDKSMLIKDFPEIMEQKPSHEENANNYGKSNKLYPEYWFPLGERKPRIKVLINAVKLIKEKK